MNIQDWFNTAWSWYEQINWFERGFVALLIIGGVYGIIEGLCHGVRDLYSAVLNWFGPKTIPQDEWAGPHRAFSKGVFLTVAGKQRRFDVQDYLADYYLANSEDRRYLVREHSGGQYAVLRYCQKLCTGSRRILD